MRKLVILHILAALCQTSFLAASDCPRCDIMRDYNAKHPSKYQYYDDYLKDLKEKGAENVDVKPEDLPPEVRFIKETK